MTIITFSSLIEQPKVESNIVLIGKKNKGINTDKLERITFIKALGRTDETIESYLTMLEYSARGSSYESISGFFNIDKTSVRYGCKKVSGVLLDYGICNTVTGTYYIRRHKDRWLSAIARVRTFLANDDMTVAEIKESTLMRKSA